jgi:pimeloyl-ACP methyl ester carboxylesterase
VARPGCQGEYVGRVQRRVHGAWAGSFAVVAVACLFAVPGVALAVPDYCEPQNDHYNPPDVPPGGSRITAVPDVTRTMIEVAGTRTPLLTSGPQASQEAIVFLHGSPGSGQDWLDLLPRAGALGRRAVAVDLPGFGHADKPWDTTNDLAEGTRWLDALLTQLDVRRVHFVIHDVGGAPALQWSSEHPERLISVVQIASGLLGYEHHGLAQIARTPLVGETFFAGVTRPVFQNGGGQEERPLPQDFADRLYDDFDRPTRCTILRIYRSADAEQINAWGTQQAAVLSRRRRPALILWGRNDPYLRVEMAERQREVFPGAALHIFEESGHWPHGDDAPGVAALFTPFIRCVPTGLRDRIRVAVRPAAVRRGARASVRFHTTVRRDGRSRPVCGAKLSLAGRTAETDGFGRASLTLRLNARKKRRTVTATKPGLRTGRGILRVVFSTSRRPDPNPRAPSFTG